MIWRKKSSFWHLAVVSEPATSGSVYGLSACVSRDVMTAEWLRRFHREDIDPPPSPSRLCGSVASFKPKIKNKKTQTSKDFQQCVRKCSCSSCVVVVVYSHGFFSLRLFSQEVFEDRVFLEEEPQKGVSTPDPPPTERKNSFIFRNPTSPDPPCRGRFLRKVGGV